MTVLWTSLPTTRAQENHVYLACHCIFMPSSSSFLRRTGSPTFSKYILAVWSLGKISRGFLVTIIPSLYSSPPSPTILRTKPQASFQSPSWGVSCRWKNPVIKSRTGWLGRKRPGEQEREKNERASPKSYFCIFLYSVGIWEMLWDLTY